MADERVDIVGPYGEKGTVAAADLPKVTAAGGRAATSEEIAAQRTEDAYQKQGTLTKVATAASMLGPAGYPLHAYLRSQGAVLPPGLEAYTQGVSSGFGGGLPSAGMKELVGAVGGNEAAKAYGQTAEDVKQAHGALYSGGELAGFLGGAVAGGPVGAVGGAAEKLAARGAVGLASRGVAGRMVATAIALGARGGAEGAMYGAAQEVSDEMLGDHDLAADKVFAAMGMGALGGALGGAALGGAGSLVASGARGVYDAASGGLSRAASRGERAAADIGAKADAAAAEAKALGKDAVAEAKSGVERAGAQAHNAVAEGVQKAGQIAEDATSMVGDATGTKAGQEATSLSDLTSKFATKDAQKGLAYDQAWKAIGAGQGLQSTAFAKRAERYLANGTRDVGEVLMRKGIINAEDGLVAAAKGGTPAAMLPKIDAELQATGQRIGQITDASGARINAVDLINAMEGIAGQYEKSAATRPAGRSIRAFGLDLFDSLGIRDVGDTVSIQDVIRERKALDRIAFGDAPTMDPKLALELKRELRGKLEGIVVDSLDEASGKVPGELKAEYKALKKDYTALSIASEAAEDSAARAAKARSVSLTDYLAGGGSIAATLGHKLVRERGNAAAAVLLYRMAEAGTITRAMARVDETIGRASKGLLVAPKSVPLPESSPTTNVRARAQEAMKNIAAAQANPEAVVDKITRATEGVGNTAPQFAGALTQRFTDAAAFLASKVPVHPDPDPFDPHQAPKLNDQQAHELMQYVGYVDRPERFFEEAAHGKLTYEGVETAKVLMPAAFAEFQQRTLTEMADMMAKGIEVPFRQRERLGVLLDIPAVPSQRPDMMRMLQANVVNSDKAAKPNAPGGGPSRPLPTKTQPSALDRLEGR